MEIQFNNVEEKIISIRDTKVIIDSDVAELYGVETKRINEAVKNNQDKFPQGYHFELDEIEKAKLVENFDHLEKLKFAKSLPKAFTEKGLYMLATILKSKKATETTIAIIETFTKIRELSRTVNELIEMDKEKDQKSLMQKSGEIFSEILGENMKTEIFFSPTLKGEKFPVKFAKITLFRDCVINFGEFLKKVS